MIQSARQSVSHVPLEITVKMTLLYQKSLEQIVCFWSFTNCYDYGRGFTASKQFRSIESARHETRVLDVRYLPTDCRFMALGMEAFPQSNALKSVDRLMRQSEMEGLLTRSVIEL